MEMTVTFLTAHDHRWPQMTAINHRNWAQNETMEALIFAYNIFIWQFGEYLFIY